MCAWEGEGRDCVLATPCSSALPGVWNEELMRARHPACLRVDVALQPARRAYEMMDAADDAGGAAGIGAVRLASILLGVCVGVALCV